MKLFSILCFSLMGAAGIYGTLDLVRDLRNGTMIEYERDHGPGNHDRDMGSAIRTAFDPRVSASSFYMDESEFSRGDGMYTGWKSTDSTQYNFNADADRDIAEMVNEDPLVSNDEEAARP